jgi:hypothetical protein
VATAWPLRPKQHEAGPWEQQGLRLECALGTWRACMAVTWRDVRGGSISDEVYTGGFPAPRRTHPVTQRRATPTDREEQHRRVAHRWQDGVMVTVVEGKV